MTLQEAQHLRQHLADLFQSVGVSFDPLEISDMSYVLGRLQGGPFVNHPQAWIKSDEKICNVSSPIGRLKSQALAVSLLKLNFRYPLGRVSAVDVASQETFIVCETMFLIRNTLDAASLQEIQLRLSSFQELRSASQALYDEAGDGAEE